MTILVIKGQQQVRKVQELCRVEIIRDDNDRNRVHLREQLVVGLRGVQDDLPLLVLGADEHLGRHVDPRLLEAGVRRERQGGRARRLALLLLLEEGLPLPEDHFLELGLKGGVLPCRNDVVLGVTFKNKCSVHLKKLLFFICFFILFFRFYTPFWVCVCLSVYVCLC